MPTGRLRGVYCLINTIGVNDDRSQNGKKVVLITGANHGIGAATAKKFAEQGAKVLVTYFREPCDIALTDLEKAKIEGQGGKRGGAATASLSGPLVMQVVSCLLRMGWGSGEKLLAIPKIELSESFF